MHNGCDWSMAISFARLSFFFLFFFCDDVLQMKWIWGLWLSMTGVVLKTCGSVLCLRKWEPTVCAEYNT